MSDEIKRLKEKLAQKINPRQDYSYKQKGLFPENNAVNDKEVMRYYDETTTQSEENFDNEQLKKIKELLSGTSKTFQYLFDKQGTMLDRDGSITEELKKQARIENINLEKINEDYNIWLHKNAKSMTDARSQEKFVTDRMKRNKREDKEITDNYEVGLKLREKQHPDGRWRDRIGYSVDSKRGVENDFNSTVYKADETKDKSQSNINKRVVNRKLFNSDREVYDKTDPKTGETKQYTKWKVNIPFTDWTFGGKEKEISEKRAKFIKKKMDKRQTKVRGSEYK